MIIFFLLNALAGVTSALAAARIFPSRKLPLFCIAFILSYSALIVFSELLLGALGQLTLGNLLVLEGCILIVLMAFTRKKAAVFPRAVGEKLRLVLTGKKVLFCLLAVILGFGIVKALINLMNPPFGWDSLNYHFTFPVEWIKSATLHNPITVSDDPSPSYYPINGSLIYLWFLWPLKSAFLADLGQLPFYLLGLCSVYALARRMRLSAEYSVLVSGLFLLIPNYFKQIEIAYVDVMVSSLFLASCVLLCEFQESKARAQAVLFGISTGLLLGTKTVALPYSALLIVPFVYICLRKRRRAYAALGWAVALIALLGGFSYLRNFFLTGNPLYPYEVAIFGKTLFKGVMDKATYGAHFVRADHSLLKLLFHEGLGAATLLFVLPGTLCAPFLAMRRELSFSWIEKYLLVVPLFIYLMYRFIIPLANVRYLYALLGIGMVNGFFLWKAAGVPQKVIRAAGLICVLSALAELAEHGELIASLILSALILVTLPYLLRKRFVPVMAGGAAIMLLLLPVAHAQYQAAEYQRYIVMQKYSGFWPDATAAWKWLNEHTAGDNIAYVGRPVPYPLYGRGFKNNVYYVSVNVTEPALLYRYEGSRYRWGYAFGELHENLRQTGNYRGNADVSVWLKNVRERATDYLFVYSLHQTDELLFPMEDAWARSRPDIFDLVFENETIRIYKVAIEE